MSPVLVSPSRFTAPGGFSAAVLATATLQVYWKNGEASGTSMVDAASGARNGAYANSPTFGAAGPLTDGSTGITLASASSQQGSIAFASWMTATSFTYGTWVKTTGASQIVLGRGSASTLGYIGLAAGGQAFIQSRNTASQNQSMTGGTVVNDGNWHFLVGVRDASNLHIYVDGVLDDLTTSGASAAVNTDTTNGMFVGSRGGSAFLNGSTAHNFMCSSALTGAQVAALFAAR